jgi:hypothetical protein
MHWVFFVKNCIYFSMHEVNNINRCSCFPHLSSDLSSEFGEILYTNSGHCGVEHLYISCTMAYARPYLLYGCKWNYTNSYTVKLQDILEVKKKSLVNFLRCVTEYRMCGLESFYRPLLDSFYTALNHFVLTQVWEWMTGLINSQNTLL